MSCHVGAASARARCSAIGTAVNHGIRPNVEKNMSVNVGRPQELTRQASSLPDRSVDTWPFGQAGCSHGSSYRR